MVVQRWLKISLALTTTHLRQGYASNLHFRQFNGSKKRNVDKAGMRNIWVLIELAATNCFQRRKELLQVTAAEFFPILQKSTNHPKSLRKLLPAIL
jgi:hypothetical protein